MRSTYGTGLKARTVQSLLKVSSVPNVLLNSVQEQSLEDGVLAHSKLILTPGENFKIVYVIDLNIFRQWRRYSS
jgi:hypothetical protein